jgi:alpha-N-arabinofuranosidase
VTFFIVNRHPDEDMTLDIGLAGFNASRIVEHVAMTHPDLRATKTARQPERVKPARGKGVTVKDGAVRGKLPPKSYHVLRVAV